MLTEGWDANTVTHILGVRAFGTQLLCEQVVGRGLRRRSYEPDENGLFTPEYADVYGVPFQFMPTVGKDGNRTIKPTRSVHALPERKESEISFPRVAGYRLEIRDPELFEEFTERSRLTLDTKDIPTADRGERPHRRVRGRTRSTTCGPSGTRRSPTRSRTGS